MRRTPARRTTCAGCVRWSPTWPTASAGPATSDRARRHPDPDRRGAAVADHGRPACARRHPARRGQSQGDRPGLVGGRGAGLRPAAARARAAGGPDAALRRDRPGSAAGRRGGHPAGGRAVRPAAARLRGRRAQRGRPRPEHRLRLLRRRRPGGAGSGRLLRRDRPRPRAGGARGLAGGAAAGPAGAGRLAGGMVRPVPGTLLSIPSPSQNVWYLGPFPLRAYALCIIAGILVGMVIATRRWRARGGTADGLEMVIVVAGPFGIIGARLYHVITDYELYFGPGRHPVDALKIWHGGLGIWGAVALGALGGGLVARRRQIRFPALLDAVAPGLAVAQAIGRLGNWF